LIIGNFSQNFLDNAFLLTKSNFYFSAAPCESNPCQNDARCMNVGPINFQCICLPGFTGRFCESRSKFYSL